MIQHPHDRGDAFTPSSNNSIEFVNHGTFFDAGASKLLWGASLTLLSPLLFFSLILFVGLQRKKQDRSLQYLVDGISTAVYRILTMPLPHSVLHRWNIIFSVLDTSMGRRSCSYNTSRRNKFMDRNDFQPLFSRMSHWSSWTGCSRATYKIEVPRLATTGWLPYSWQLETI
jgi:hypothetical protein